MGNTISLVRHVFVELFDNMRMFQTLKERVMVEPGLPVENPSRSFWMSPLSAIADYCSDLPQHVDVVVIGSGITGTSVARTLLERAREAGKLPVVLMLEARDACSGATGRNGGHISPAAYQDFMILKDHGDVAAQKMVKFRFAHVQELRRVAEEEGLLEQSQWRQVELVDAFFNKELFEKSKAKVRVFQKAMPSEASHYRLHESAEAIQKYNLASDAVGCITSDAGAIHPYKLVTGILSNLLTRHPENFLLCTHTPCTSITGPSASDHLYTVNTPKGSVKTTHVIHATNGWSSHLLAPMRGRIIPFRGNMTAQRPGQSLSADMLQRSFVFYEAPATYDYLTQLPDGERELMLGGAFTQEGHAGNEAAANTDDSTYCKRVSAHLAGVLPRYFGEDNWGREGQPPDEDTKVEWSQGRVKAAWSGILGISSDLLPWVGRLPPSVSGRPDPSNQGSLPNRNEGFVSTAPGEWIAAGYTGEGMVHAWMSGKALAEMILGREREGGLAEWFPDMMRVSAGRWRKATPEGMLDYLSRFD